MSEPTSEPAPSGRRTAAGSGVLGPARVLVLVVLGYAVLGAVAGAVWELVWTPPGQVIQQHQVYADSYASLRGVFNGTALYVVVGALASAVAGLVTTLLVRGRELLVLVLVLLGSAIAACVMLRVGTALGPPDPATIAAHTTGRLRVQGKLSVEGRSPYLVWPVASLIVLALVYFATSGRSATRPGGRSTPPTDAHETDAWPAPPR